MEIVTSENNYFQINFIAQLLKVFFLICWSKIVAIEGSLTSEM